MKVSGSRIYSDVGATMPDRKIASVDPGLVNEL
jgi:hypothetical protein